jgi:S1-C subfamily serine protease
VAILGFPIPDGFADLHLEIEPSVYSGRIASVRRGALELAVPITAGESGGPIFRTSDGALIGIVESRFDDERAIGFGLPASEFQSWLHTAQ